MRDDAVYLAHIAESLALVDRYLAAPDGGHDERRFFDDSFTQDAVLRRLETLSDGAGHLSDALKRRHPEVSWRAVTDFRNVLAHEYTDLDLPSIWQTIRDDLPVLQRAVAAEILRLGGSG